MDDFERELMRRSPLAASVLETCDYLFADELLESIWEEHRGRCYTDKLRFEDLLRLVRDALIRHDGSAHKMFLELESEGIEPVNESSFYRKLANTPEQLSQALLRECTARLTPLMPQAVKLPACFDAFAVFIADGKKIKNVAKRLEPTRGFDGKMLGAKALVALDARTGLAVAMSDSLDGMTNDVPLVPMLVPQLIELAGDRPMLSVVDRQFDDQGTMRRLSVREGDAFIARMKQMHRFAVENAVESIDPQGRRVLDEIGTMGRGKQAMRVRRITLFRTGADEEDVVLLTNLMDRDAYDAQSILELYKKRWAIEQVFQQVTETFSLTHLIGCGPKAVLLQFAFCLLLYNLMQVIRTYVAEDGKVLASAVSMFYLFDDTRTELVAWAYHTDGNWPRMNRDAAGMRGRLRELLKGSWDPIRYTKAADKKPRRKPPPRKRLHGGHSSVQRALEGRVKVLIT